MASWDTPRTDAGNATFMTHDHNFDEQSILSPIKKKKDDLVTLMRNERGASLKTPRARVPLADRRNMVNGHKENVEFTPLLQSVTKRNLERKIKPRTGPTTPAFLKAGYKSRDSPALPKQDMSMLYSSDFGSSVNGLGASTPLPQIISSSAQSTPLVALPKRDATGVLNEQGNLMTLREQENIIDKVEKENFGLKLKIHFLEDALRRAGPGFNEAALQENTDLRVDRAQLQRELARCRKTLTRAERDLELYKRHLEDMQAKAQRADADETVREEIEELKRIVTSKEEEIEEFRTKFETLDQDNAEAEEYKNQVDDLAAELREKNRQIDAAEDELESAKLAMNQKADELAEVVEELESERKRASTTLEANEDRSEARIRELQTMKADLEDALAAQRKSENDLEELQDEIANKSFSTKGLGRQREEKLAKLQDDLNAQRQEYTQLQQEYKNKETELLHARENTQHNKDVDQATQDKLTRLEFEHEATVRRCEQLDRRVEVALEELQIRTEEKDVLHSRYDALVEESQALQGNLANAQTNIEELETALQSEQEHAQENDIQLRQQAEVQHNKLNEELDSLRREFEDRESEFDSQKDQWESDLRNLESQKEKIAEKAAGLERTINAMHDSEGSVSEQAAKFQEALQSERQRHEDEEAVLQRQVSNLKTDIEEKRNQLEEAKKATSQIEESLRRTERERTGLVEKCQALEDEVDVLQNELENADMKHGQQNLTSHLEELDTLRAELQSARDHIEDLEAAMTPNGKEAEDSTLNRYRNDLMQSEMARQKLDALLESTTIELRQVRHSSTQLELERDSDKQRLKEALQRSEEVNALELEKIGWRSSKSRLEHEMMRLKEERRTTLESKAAIQARLEEEVSRSAAEEARLLDEVERLERRTKAPSIDNGQRDLIMANKKIERLERRLREAEENQMDITKVTQHDDEEALAEIEFLKAQLADNQTREAKLLEREVIQKAKINELKASINSLERNISRSADSPRMSTSVHQRAVDKLQAKLDSVSREFEDAQRQSSNRIDELEQALATHAPISKSGSAAWPEDFASQLSAGLAAAQEDLGMLQSRNSSTSETISRLRKCISTLESNVQSQRHIQTVEESMARERLDLYELLKQSKLQAEDLRIQIESREKSLSVAATKESELRSQLRRVREARNSESARVKELAVELEASRRAESRPTQSRAGGQLEQEATFTHTRHSFFKAPFMSHGDVKAPAELGDNNQSVALQQEIRRLRVQWRREEGFRRGLTYEKEYLLKDIAMREQCSKSSLLVLKKILQTSFFDRVKDDPRVRLGEALLEQQQQRTCRGKPTLKVVALSVLAVQRMKRLAWEWQGKR